jgi:hypothetical protein
VDDRGDSTVLKSSLFAPILTSADLFKPIASLEYAFDKTYEYDGILDDSECSIQKVGFPMAMTETSGL